MIDATWSTLYHTMARDVCRASLKYFVQEFWGEIVMERLVWNWHMEEICDQLQAMGELVLKGAPKEADLIVNVPPGSSKSLLCSIMFPAWAWTRNASMRFICVSYSSSLSTFLSMRCRDLVKSEKYRAYYPMVKIRKEQDQKTYFQLVGGGDRFATSVGATVTGYHGHFLIVDDPISPDEAISDSQLRSHNFWLENTLLQRPVEKAVTLFVLIMQRLHEDDPTGYFLNSKMKLKHLCFPAEKTEDISPPERAKKYIDGLLDPVRMPLNVLENIRNRGAYTYAGQYLQRPAPMGDGVFKVEKIELLPIAPAKLKMKVRYWDKAGTAGAGAYTAGVLMGKCMDNSFIVLDVVRGQWSYERREMIIKRTAQMDGVDVPIYLEQEPGSGGKESAEASIANLAGFCAKADRPQGDKNKRAEPFAVQTNIGKVRAVKADWNKDYFHELLNFPVGKYKDQVDASSGAFAHLTRHKRAGSW